MSYFQGSRDFTINGGHFGPDNSRHTTYRGNVHRTNDYSQHTINYGGYVNRGQHAATGGTINNFRPQTRSNGSQQRGSSGGYRQSPRPPSPPDNDFDTYSSVPDLRQGYPQQDPLYDSEPTYGGPESDDDAFYEEAPRPAPPPRVQRRTAPAHPPRGKKPRTQDVSLDEELKDLSPEMQRYVQMLQKTSRAMPPDQPEKDLQDLLADMRLDDDEPSKFPAGRTDARPRPQRAPRRDMNAPRGTRMPNHSRFAESHRHNPTAEEYESDEDSAGGSIINNANSQNVNSSTVVDSHNDNSTKTEISKSRSAR